MGRRRPRLIAGSVLLAMALLSGCADTGSDDAPPMGADLSKVGPSPLPSTAAVPALTTPAASEAPEADESVAPTLPPALVTFEKAVTKALQPTDVTAAATLELELRPYAQNQLVITWTATTAGTDKPGGLVREEVKTVLTHARTIGMNVSSVLVIVHGAITSDSGVGSIAQLVRAKYSERLVKGTNWSSVAASEVLGMVDDKAAELHPAVR